MNIFYLDHDQKECARMHCNKHVIKMIVETAQLLSCAHHMLDKHAAINGLYKLTHKNHPTAIWVRSNNKNYEWTFVLFQCLLAEYTKRYKKIHKSSEKLPILKNNPKNIPISTFYPPPLAMPEKYHSTNAIESYRTYYLNDKIGFCKWKQNDIPDWFLEKLNVYTLLSVLD